MSAGITSLALHFPTRLRPNQYWRDNYPEMVANAENSIVNKVWAAIDDDHPIFDEAMKKYLSDPFRGVQNRHWLEEGQSSLSIEVAAAKKAIAARGIDVRDIDLLLCSSFFPDEISTGNAAFVARDLGLTGNAWNLESACSSSNVALATAAALVDAGQYRSVLCVVSCSYSRVCPETDSLSWSVGDGAAAFIVEKLPDGFGVLSTFGRHTGDTCGAITVKPTRDGDDVALSMVVHPETGRIFRSTSSKNLRYCVQGALERIDASIEDVAFFVFNTPAAWYGEFCQKTLDIDANKTISVHHLYANTGPVLMPSNLFHALADKRIHAGDLVCLYSVGSVSSSAATLMRWSDCSLG